MSNDPDTTILTQGSPQVNPSGVVLSVTTTSVTISWNNVSSSSDQGYSAITQYNIYQKNGATYPATPTTTSLTGLGTTISGLTMGQSYSFKVTVSNVFGESDINTATEYTVLLATVPNQMAPVTITQVGTDV